nr:hypothetical protein Itr_chr13CG01240 [Ipomoea trifida]
MHAYPRIAWDRVLFWPTMRRSIPSLALWERMIEPLSFPSIMATLSVCTILFGCAISHARFNASKNSNDGKGGHLKKEPIGFFHAFVWFSMWRRIMVSPSRIAWDRAYSRAAADSRVGSATTITLRL